MTEYSKLMNNLLNIKVAADKDNIASDNQNDDGSKYSEVLKNLHYNKYLLDKSRLHESLKDA